MEETDYNIIKEFGEMAEEITKNHNGDTKNKVDYILSLLCQEFVYKPKYVVSTRG